MATSDYSRPIYRGRGRDRRVVGYTPAASPYRRLVAILRDHLPGMTTARAERLARELRR